MRESRSYGSVRGATSDGRPYRNTWTRIALVSNRAAVEKSCTYTRNESWNHKIDERRTERIRSERPKETITKSRQNHSEYGRNRISSGPADPAQVE
jgi:hypothetical protein